jgi:hypothetical protein
MHPNAIHAIANATKATKLSPPDFFEAILVATVSKDINRKHMKMKMPNPHRQCQ